jgi:uncharacterized protein (TIGR02285 family)
MDLPAMLHRTTVASQVHRLVCLLVSILPFAAHSAAEVEWYVGDHPPFFIPYGELAGKGGGDLQMHYLMSLLPQYRHRVVSSDAARTIHDFQYRDGVCAVDLVRTPDRDRFIRFGTRPLRLPGWHLILSQQAKAKIAASLSEDGQIDLEALARSGGLAGAYVPARFYSEAIDRFVSGETGGGRLTQVMQTSPMLNLMHAKRIDYFIGLPQQVPYYSLLFPADPQLESVAIKGVQPLTDLFIGCSDQPLGRDIIAHIDSALQGAEAWAGFVQPLSPWLSPEDFAFALGPKSERHN